MRLFSTLRRWYWNSRALSWAIGCAAAILPPAIGWLAASASAARQAASTALTDPGDIPPAPTIAGWLAGDPWGRAALAASLLGILLLICSMAFQAQGQDGGDSGETADEPQPAADGGDDGWWA